MKALALLCVLLLVLLHPVRYPARQRLGSSQPLRHLAPVRIVRSPRAALLPKTVKEL